ncbi:MAG: TMEM175 family protein [Ktedonobacterales bacterium]
MEQKRGSRTAEGVEEKETGRLEAFSDGVFAIAITLLILTIRVPSPSDLSTDDGLLHVVLKRWPSFLAYVLSFVTILIMWVNHHALFTMIRRIDHTFLMINGLLLMMVTFVNYPTALVAESLREDLPSGLFLLQGTANQRAAALIYSGAFVVTAILFNVLWGYAARNGRLLARNYDRELADLITRQYRFGPLFYLVAFLFAFVSAPASIAVNALLAVYFSFTGTRRGGKPGEGAPEVDG